MGRPAGLVRGGVRTMTTVTSEPTPGVSAVSPELEAFIQGERRRADVTGTAVAAFDRDGMRFAEGFGFADRERGERATPETLFRAASISKLFTTTLVLQEVESGRIALDAPMNQYLDPRVRIRNKHGGTADDVNIRHLLTHTSGLPVSWRGLDYGPLWWKLIANNGLPPASLEDVVSGMRTIRAPRQTHRLLQRRVLAPRLPHRADQQHPLPRSGARASAQAAWHGDLRLPARSLRSRHRHALRANAGLRRGPPPGSPHLEPHRTRRRAAYERAGACALRPHGPAGRRTGWSEDARWKDVRRGHAHSGAEPPGARRRLGAGVFCVHLPRPAHGLAHRWPRGCRDPDRCSPGRWDWRRRAHERRRRLVRGARRRAVARGPTGARS